MEKVEWIGGLLDYWSERIADICYVFCEGCTGQGTPNAYCPEKLEGCVYSVLCRRSHGKHKRAFLRQESKMDIGNLIILYLNKYLL